MILTAYNPSTDNLEKTYLSFAYAAGTTLLVTRNTDRFTNGARILIGEMGNEKTEIVTATTINNKTDMVVTATSFPHNASDPVYVMKYDQAIFYRSTTTVDGSYSQLAVVPLDVDNADLQTQYNDPNGLPTYFYKVSYYNSVTMVESEMSDPIPGTGYTREQVGAFVTDFLIEIGDTQQELITVPQILSILNECNDELIGQSKKPYRFLKATGLVSLSANANTAPWPEDMWKFNNIRYNWIDGISNTYRDLPIITMDEMDYRQYDTNEMATNDATYVALDDTDNQFVFRYKARTLQTNTFKVRYWRKFLPITSLADKLETFGLTRVYKMYLLGRFYRMRAVKESSFLAISDRFFNDYNTEVVKLQRTMAVDIGSPEGFKPGPRNGIGLRR